MRNQRENSQPVVLTIAGSDSGGGAGIQADLKTFQALRCYGTTAITAITAQNTKTVMGVQPVDADMVRKQLEAVLDDFSVVAAKTGMLFSAEIIEAVRQVWHRRAQHIPLVVDPVMVSSSGAILLQPEAIAALGELMRLARLITPNIPEAEALLGRPVQSDSSVKEAALELHDHFGAPVLIKGGHRMGGDDRVVDVLYDGTRFLSFASERLPGKNTHGTGCTLAAAIVAGLARGRDLQEAVGGARDFLLGAIRGAPGLGEGIGPVNHMWKHDA